LIAEGETKIYIVKGIAENHRIGPGDAKVPVFFNPAMEFSRDISILVLEEYLKSLEPKLGSGKKIKLLDGLAGTGIRGVRMGNEILNAQSSEVSITINDHNPLAYKLILKNIEVNQLKNAIATKNNLNSILSNERFDYIDIDPFGSPIKFLDSGSRMLRNNGILAVTATDTAPLFGRYPKTCLRKYDAWSCRSGFSHEQGLRILVGCCVRTAGRYNLALNPILAHGIDHYYRVYFRGTRSRGAVDNCLNEVGYIAHLNNSNKYKIIKRKDTFSKPKDWLNNILHSKKRDGFNLAGPLWIGKLFDNDFVNNLSLGSHRFGTQKRTEKMLALFTEEAEAPPGFYDANLLSSELKVSSPPIQKIIQVLKDNGNLGTRTHFNPNGFKTDAPFETVAQILMNI
jgi:tRNA (guanine26-N2/guanine27-N2)-dimethyltransferase